MGKNILRNKLTTSMLSTLVLTLLCFVGCCVASAIGYTQVSIVTLIGLLGLIVLLPMIALGAWCVYAKKYIDAVFEDTNNLWRLYVRVGVSMLCGIITFGCGLNIFVYVLQNSKILDGLYGCIFLKMMVCLLWFICTCYGAYCVKRNDTIERMRIYSFVVAICMMLAVTGYSWWKTEDVFYEKMVEYYEQYNGEQSQEPFLSH